MTRGAIKAAALEDNRGAAIALTVVVAICAGILGLNWRYVYNFVTGPYQFDSALSAAPGPREFVRATGTLVPTGVVEELTIRLLRGATESKSVTAQYLAMKVDGRLLIVKTEPDFSGSIVEGRLVPLPVAVGAELRGLPSHPWMIDAETGYRWDFNLFVMIAAPLLVLALPFLVHSLVTLRSPASHAALKKLKRFGTIDQVVARIEDELMFAGDRGRVGSLWITPSWIVGLQPTLRLWAIADLMGVGIKTTQSKKGPKIELVFWNRGQSIEDTMTTSDTEARQILAAIAAKHPWAVVEDVTVFDKRWRSGRAEVEQEVDARRKAV
jgi:hypothetical protein